MIFLLKFWMNASNMKQSECRLKFTWLNLTRKLKTILLFSHFSLTDIFSTSTCRILSRTKGVRMYDCITWKHIINLNIDCSYSCIVLFCFNDNGDSVARPTSFQNRRKHDRKPSEFIVHDRISGRRFSSVLYKEPRLLRRSNERIRLFPQTVRCSTESPSPPYPRKQKKNASCYFLRNHYIDSFFYLMRGPLYIS